MMGTWEIEETLKNIIEKVAENKVFEIVKNAIKLDTKEVSIEELSDLRLYS